MKAQLISFSLSYCATCKHCQIGRGRRSACALLHFLKCTVGGSTGPTVSHRCSTCAATSVSRSSSSAAAVPIERMRHNREHSGGTPNSRAAKALSSPTVAFLCTAQRRFPSIGLPCRTSSVCQTSMTAGYGSIIVLPRSVPFRTARGMGTGLGTSVLGSAPLYHCAMSAHAADGQHSKCKPSTSPGLSSGFTPISTVTVVFEVGRSSCVGTGDSGLSRTPSSLDTELDQRLHCSAHRQGTKKTVSPGTGFELQAELIAFACCRRPGTLRLEPLLRRPEPLRASAIARDARCAPSNAVLV